MNSSLGHYISSCIFFCLGFPSNPFHAAAFFDFFFLMCHVVYVYFSFLSPHGVGKNSLNRCCVKIAKLILLLLGHALSSFLESAVMYSLCTVRLIAGRQLESDCNTVPENASVVEYSKVSRRKSLVKGSQDKPPRL